MTKLKKNRLWNFFLSTCDKTQKIKLQEEEKSDSGNNDSSDSSNSDSSISDLFK